jgi:hypothetical protein
MASIMGFFIGRAIANAHNLPPDSAMKYATLGAVAGASTMGILVIDIAAKREEETQQQQVDAAQNVTVPDVKSRAIPDAAKAVVDAHLKPIVEVDAAAKLVVVTQDPEPNAQRPAGSEVKLTAGLPTTSSSGADNTPPPNA